MAMETEQVQTVTISGMPEDLLRQIDKLAGKEDRTRSSFIRRELERIVEEKKHAKAA